MVERGQMHREMIGDSQWSSWCAPLFRISDACFPFFRRLGLLGQDGDSKGGGGLVVVVRVVQIHESKSERKKKTIGASRNGQQKGDFFIKENSGKESLEIKDANF